MRRFTIVPVMAAIASIVPETTEVRQLATGGGGANKAPQIHLLRRVQTASVARQTIGVRRIRRVDVNRARAARRARMRPPATRKLASVCVDPALRVEIAIAVRPASTR